MMKLFLFLAADNLLGTQVGKQTSDMQLEKGYR